MLTSLRNSKWQGWRRFIAAQAGAAAAGRQLLAGFPSRPLLDDSATLEGAGLLNSVVTQRSSRRGWVGAGSSAAAGVTGAAAAGGATVLAGLLESCSAQLLQHGGV
jgi:hypothetical protein